METGYTAPVVSTTVDNKTVQIVKPRENWEETDYKNLGWNSKAIHAIFLGVSRDEFHRISHCEIAKEAWDILETTHEGTTSVKRAKLQLLTTKFEMERMKDDESFDEFNARLSDIVNSCHGLGEPILESKVVRKFLRSLPDRFAPKVTAIEESKDMDQMKREELVGSLQTYEVNLRPSEKDSRNKGIAFKTVKEESSHVDSDSDSMDDDMALVVKKFKKFLKKNSRGQSHPAPRRNQDKPRNQSTTQKERPTQKTNEKLINMIQCYDCQGYGHISSECPNRTKHKISKNERGMNVVQTNDSSDSESENSLSDKEGGNFTAFVVSTIKVGESSLNNDNSDKEDHVSDCVESASDGTSEYESEGDTDLQTAYDELYKKYMKLTKGRISVGIQCKNLEKERDALKSEVDELRVHVNQLQTQCSFFANKVIILEKELICVNESKVSLEQVITNLEKDLKDSRETAEKLSNGKETLDKILGMGQSPNNRHGLGFVDERITPPVNTKFVKAKAQVTPTTLLYPPPRFLPTCVHCGVKGHIRPKCPKLRGINGSYRRVPHKNESKDFQGRLRALVDHSSWLCKEVEHLAQSTMSQHSNREDFKRDNGAPKRARRKRNKRRNSNRVSEVRMEREIEHPPIPLVDPNSNMKTIWLRKDELEALLTHSVLRADVALGTVPCT